jgi:hypothetical protein
MQQVSGQLESTVHGLVACILKFHTVKLSQSGHERGDGRPDGVHEPDLGDGGDLPEAGRRGGNLRKCMPKLHLDHGTTLPRYACGGASEAIRYILGLARSQPQITSKFSYEYRMAVLSSMGSAVEWRFNHRLSGVFAHENNVYLSKLYI